MANLDKPAPVLQPECLDAYGLKPCLPEYLTRMRTVVRQNGWNISNIFEKDDPLEWGTVSEHVFKCMMNERFACTCGFSPEVINAVTELFRMPDNMICYKRLHNLMLTDENMAQTLRECASSVPFPVVRNLPLRYCGKPVYGTTPPIPVILERLRTAYYRLRIKITDLFRCCDPTGTGLVDEKNFQCILKQRLIPEAGLTDLELDALTNYYRACGDNIDYKRFSDMFESTLGIQEQIQKDYITSREELKIPRLVNQLCEPDELKVEEILCKIVTRASRSILTTLSAIFHKFAYRQTGETTVPHLRRFLEYLGTSLVESDFNLLCKKYSMQGLNVNFLALVEDLDNKFHEMLCPKFPERIVGADGPKDLVKKTTHCGAWATNSAYLPGKCICATEAEHKKGRCMPNDASRFYEGGPIVGGSGKPPVFGYDYVSKRLNAIPGQRYGGCVGLSPPAGKPSANPVSNTTEVEILRCESDWTDLKALMERLQQFLYRYQIRAKDFFKDYDPLHTGCVSANQFRRGLSDMGICVLGRLNLTEGEFDALVNFYRLPEDVNRVCWRKFESDIESVFIQKGLEKNPLHLSPQVRDIVELPAKGKLGLDDLPQKYIKLACCALARLKSRVEIENCNIKYFFQGFDKVNNGYISRQQFKQTLTMLNYNFSDEEIDALSMKYYDENGFNYLKLMADIEPKPEDCGWYQRYKQGRLYRMAMLPPPPKWIERDIQRIMYKIQARMVRCRPKLKDFLLDHDLFHHDRIKILDFHRAMDRAGFELTPAEVDTLICCFQSPEDPLEIEWRCLNEAIETCFTIFNLEKAPRITPQEWHPLREMDYDKVMLEQDFCYFTDGMRRLARQAHHRRIAIKPMFQDFDHPHAGLVSEDQFHRVLQTVGLAGYLTPNEFHAICKRYQVIRGNKKDIDYVEFLANLEATQSIVPLTLEEMSPTGVAWYKQLHSCCS